MDYGLPAEELDRVVGSGEPFRTSGCTGYDGQVACNRPFANSRPGPDMRNYPFPPTVEDIDRRQRGEFEAGIPSGFGALDSRTGGWQRENLIVVGGRPGNGKTALGIQLAYAAATEGRPVLFYSLEMSDTEVGLRLLSYRTRIDGYRLRNASNLSDSDRQLIVARAGEISQQPIDIQAEPIRTVTQIASEARRQARSDRGLGCLLIDYLQLITPDIRRGEKPSRQEQVAQMSRQLKQLAKECEIPVIVLAQVNRQSAKDLRAPRLNELRESGAIEQDADMVLFVHRPRSEEAEANQSNDPASDEPYEPGLDRNTENGELVLAKNRMGPTGTIKVRFHRPTATFLPAADERQERQNDFADYGDSALPAGDRIDDDAYETF